MKTKEETFPIIEKCGSVSVKVYRAEKPSGVYYRVMHYEGGKRVWQHFKTLEKARGEAEEKARQLARGDVDALQVTGRDRLVYGRALDSLKPFGVSLDAAAHEYAEARKVLGGYSLVEAAAFFMRHHGQGIKAKPVREAVDAMIEEKRAAGLSALYRTDLEYRLGGFAEAFHCNVDSILPDDVNAWLGSLKVAPRSFNNFLGTLRTFFAFAQSKGWLAKDANLLTTVSKRKGKAAPVEVFTPAELAVLLAHASDDVAACIALAAFAGVRSEEILRLEWADLERRPGFVELAAAKTKTASRRLVPIAGNLARWLAVAPRKDGEKGRLVWPHSKPYLFESFRNAVDAANKAAKKAAKGGKPPQKLEWKTNALRHSFITYRLAEIQDVNRVALEAGNSAKMIFQHYRELATPEQAKTWFAIAPETGRNIVSMGKAA